MSWPRSLSSAKNNNFHLSKSILTGSKAKVKFDEPLREKTSFKIGGPAKFFIEPYDINDLRLLITQAKRYKLPVFVIGAGSNILISDKGLKAMVFKLNSPFFKKIFIKPCYLEAGSGLAISQLIQSARNLGLSGIEFLAGIPGTVGGALAMNAGAWGKAIGELVEKVKVMDYKGNIKILSRKEIKFGYRKSSLAKFIILSARFKLVKKDKTEISGNIKRYLEFRRNSQDVSLPNAGCIFKNPFRAQAGRLIDLCGLKGKRIGGAFISYRHANFILNSGDASACDIVKLIELAKRRVKNKFNINLEPEIKIWQ